MFINHIMCAWGYHDDVCDVIMGYRLCQQTRYRVVFSLRFHE